MTYHDELKAWKCAYWRRLLDAAGGRVSLAARAAGVHKSYVYKLLRELGIPWAEQIKQHRGNWGDLSH